MRKTLLGVGDSLVYGLSEKLFMPHRFINLGVPGDETTDVIRRLGAHRPSRYDCAFILVGINDLLRDMNKMISRDDEETIGNIITLATTLKKSRFEGRLLIVGLLPVSAHTKYVKEDDVQRTNVRINAFNAALKNRAVMHGLDMIDVNPSFQQGGRMNFLFTTDGIHLTEQGKERLAHLITGALS
jgi:lysophospholipase L1-like esterase